MISRLVLVHLCPAVPTAPKTTAGTAIFKSASGVRIIALFPPSSKIDLPNLPAITCEACLPTAVEPVIEIRGIRLSFNNRSPMVEPFPTIKEKIPLLIYQYSIKFHLMVNIIFLTLSI